MTWLKSLNVGMKDVLHNWVVLSLLVLSVATAAGVVQRYFHTGDDVPPGVLQLVLYELGAVLSAIGVVGGLHTYKAIKGVEGDQPTPPSAAVTK